jgi:hypothetical protein
MFYDRHFVSGLWTLAKIGARSCPDGTRTPLVTECSDAAAAILGSLGKKAGRDLQVGDGTGSDTSSWGGVPPGCSIQSGGDWSTHFNMGSGGNNGVYSPVCSGLAELPSNQSAESDTSGWAKAFVAVIVVGAIASLVGLVVYKRRVAHRRAIAGQAEGTGLQPVANSPTFVVGVPLASCGDM